MSTNNVHQMMAEIAKAGGAIEYGENHPPFPQEMIDTAEAAGWLRTDTTGGGWSPTEELALTDEGRRLMGLPPRFSLWRLAVETITGLFGKQGRVQ